MKKLTFTYIFSVCLGMLTYGQSSVSLPKQALQQKAWWQSMEASVKSDEEFGSAILLLLGFKLIEQRDWDRKYKLTLRVQDIQDISESTRKSLQVMKKHLIDKIGGGLNPKTGLPYQWKEKTKATQYLQQQAKAHEKKLNDYTLFLNKQCKELGLEKLSKLVVISSGRSFYEEYYKGATLLESLITLTHWDTLLMDHKLALLQKIEEMKK